MMSFGKMLCKYSQEKAMRYSSNVNFITTSYIKFPLEKLSSHWNFDGFCLNSLNTTMPQYIASYMLVIVNIIIGELHI